MTPGLVLLSGSDTDAPTDLPAVGTVSKDAPGDDGGFALGAAAAARGATWCDRFFWTGNPDPLWLAGRCDDALEAGAAWAQCGNELNLELEGFQGGPEAYFALEDAVRSHVVDPSRLLAMPPSPGVPGWEAWVRDIGDHACHAYGSCDGMRQIVEWFLANTTGAVVVTECNFGAGNTVDVDAWAHNELDPFLAWCASEPRVKACLWFAWRWDASPTLPSSVDACACPALLEVLRKYAVPPDPPDPPDPEEPMPDIVLSVPTKTAMASPSNYQAGPRASTVGVVLHTTRGNASSLASEYAATVNWFANPQAQVSAHLVVGPEEVARCVHDDDIAWHARSANSAFLGIEIAQPTITSAVTDFQYRAAAEACRKWAAVYGFPLERSMTCRTAGLIGHEDSEPGQADGKTDPGVPPAGVFDWERFVALCRDGTVPPPADPTALQEQAWALGDQLQKLGPPYEAAGYPHRAAYVRNQGEAIKEWVNTASKGQK